MEQIIGMLSTKLPLELVHKIIYEYGCVVSPTAALIKEEFNRCSSNVKNWLYLRRPFISRIRDTVKELDEGRTEPYLCHHCGVRYADSKYSALWWKVKLQCHIPHLPCGWDPYLSAEAKIERANRICQRLDLTLTDKQWAILQRIIDRCDNITEALYIINDFPIDETDDLDPLWWIFDYAPRFNRYMDTIDN